MGDAGAPLYCYRNKQWRLEGIAMEIEEEIFKNTPKKIQACYNTKGGAIFTRFKSFQKWIRHFSTLDERWHYSLSGQSRVSKSYVTMYLFITKYSGTWL